MDHDTFQSIKHLAQQAGWRFILRKHTPEEIKEAFNTCCNIWHVTGAKNVSTTPEWVYTLKMARDHVVKG